MLYLSMSNWMVSRVERVRPLQEHMSSSISVSHVTPSSAHRSTQICVMFPGVGQALPNSNGLFL